MTVPLSAGGATGPTRRHDLEGLLGDAGSSGFEGVACDGAGRVLVLQEGASRVLVLADGLARLAAAVDLDIAPGQPGFGREWAADDNACREGLLLMARGHMLVAKQKDPVCLIEFGPAGDAPLGVSPETLLAPGARVALPRRPRGGTIGYGVLGWWELAGRDADRVESANDLALDAAGRVLLVSSRSRRIARIEGPLEPGTHRAGLDEDWRLPGLPGRGRPRPEALCAGDDALFVGLDSRDPGDNLLALEPLP